MTPLEVGPQIRLDLHLMWVHRLGWNDTLTPAHNLGWHGTLMWAHNLGWNATLM